MNHPSPDQIELIRIDATRGLDAARRSQLGQFLTPNLVARLAIGMFRPIRGDVRLLDAGAGAGSLTAAFVRAACTQQCVPSSISVVAVEIDQHLLPFLNQSLDVCRSMCDTAGISFRAKIIEGDFIVHAVRENSGEMFSGQHSFSHAVLNPPYKKIQSTSRTRIALRSIGIETTNLYTAFLELAARSLDDQGELVAITPRSFCNGIYFREFRKRFTSAMRFDHFHVFDSRTAAFSEDKVLQENVISHAVRGGQSSVVTITAGHGPSDGCATMRQVPFEQFIYPHDAEMFIHLTPDSISTDIARRMLSLPGSLKSLGASVSTGRVVEFRSKSMLRMVATASCAPLIYPRHFSNGRVAWPHPDITKPNAIAVNDATRDLLVHGGPYVLVKRFSSKEERRRVVAAVYDVAATGAHAVAFENHVNFFHHNGGPLPRTLCTGLCAFLNSTLVDSYFRQFSGSTQVNATDLRNLPYPSSEQLERIGRLIGTADAVQRDLDTHVETVLFANT